MRTPWLGPSMRVSGALIAVLVAGGLLAPSSAPAAAPGSGSYVPGKVVVRYRGEPTERELRLPAGLGVPNAVRTLRHDPEVAYANPDYLVTASAGCGFPNDPGHGGPDCWRDDQWNFLAPTTVQGGVDAVGAWQNLAAAGDPGAHGITVAVLDTGIAYRDKGRRFRRDPDLPQTKRFVDPADFVGHDRVPLDQDGHGTHVAGTIAQRTNNHRGLTGLAYGVRLMPVRVLDRREKGSGTDVARGIRYATKHGADVVNLSLEFKPQVTRCTQVVSVCKAIDQAVNKGVVVVAAAGNHSRAHVAYPAAAPGAIAVGATTYRGCLAEYSDHGDGLDLVAPGGGLDASGTLNPACRTSAAGPGIRQFSLEPAAGGEFGRFGIVGLAGTSMAAAHVSAAAAIVLGAGYPATEVASRLECTARPVGDPSHYGAGLLDAAQATSPAIVCP
jgi:serine protease